MSILARQQEYTKAPHRRSGGSVWHGALAGTAMLGAIAALELFAIGSGRTAGVVVSGDAPAETVMADVVASGGLPLRIERSAIGDALVWIVQPDGGDFVGRMRARGYWLVINPWAFGGCLIQARN
ncbi:MAG: hypothetical protein FJX35_21080 [Alphaproteobacteria bacterium]|nr:hypothetical protein [Alphaproteobacteria bacterium]